jgi:hypothetical protein
MVTRTAMAAMRGRGVPITACPVIMAVVIIAPATDMLGRIMADGLLHERSISAIIDVSSCGRRPVPYDGGLSASTRRT